MSFVADDLADWLIGLLADAGMRKLSEFMRGTDQERALRSAAQSAIEQTAVELVPAGGEEAEGFARVVSQVFGEPAGSAAPDGQVTLLEALQGAIASQLAVLGDAEITETGRSSAELLGVEVPVLTEVLTRQLVQEIIVQGAKGGSLTPLAIQLNHDSTHLQNKRLAGQIRDLTVAVQEALNRLDDAQRAALQAPPVAVASEPQGAAPEVCDSGLPRDSSAFTGREGELARLEASLESSGGVLAIHAVDGLAGVGKTAFAVHAAHRMAHRFPDGQVFVRLHAHTPGMTPIDPADVLADLLLGDGLAPSELPDGLEGRSRLWRGRTASRQMLLILDDAADSAQVLPLLPAAPGTLVLVTSRRRLDALPDVVPFSLGPLPQAEAATLIARTARRPDLDATSSDVVRLTELCGSLPLALSIIAARLAAHPDWSVADLVTQLTQAEDRLGALAGSERSVAAALELSYRDLDVAQSRLLRLLGAHPGTSYEPEATAALLDVDASAARLLLNALEGHRLLDETTPGRYRMHDLIRTYAADTGRRDHPQESDAALARLLKHYASRTPRPGPRGIPAQENVLAWLRAERENLLACIDYAYHADRHADALSLSGAVAPVLLNDGPWDVAVSVQTGARDLASQVGDFHEQANALSNLGEVLWMGGHLAEGEAALTEARNLYRQIGAPPRNANVLIQLGHLNSNRSAAQELYSEARDLARQAGDQHGQAKAFTSLGMRRLETGRYAEAIDDFAEALTLYRNIGVPEGQANALVNLGQALLKIGRHAEAETTYTEARDLARQFGYWQDEAFALSEMGRLRQMAGDHAAADALSRKAREVLEQAWRRLGIDPLE